MAVAALAAARRDFLVAVSTGRLAAGTGHQFQARPAQPAAAASNPREQVPYKALSNSGTAGVRGGGHRQSSSPESNTLLLLRLRGLALPNCPAHTEVAPEDRKPVRREPHNGRGRAGIGVVEEGAWVAVVVVDAVGLGVRVVLVLLEAPRDKRVVAPWLIRIGTAGLDEEAACGKHVHFDAVEHHRIVVGHHETGRRSSADRVGRDRVRLVLLAHGSDEPASPVEIMVRDRVRRERTAGPAGAHNEVGREGAAGLNVGGVGRVGVDVVGAVGAP